MNKITNPNKQANYKYVTALSSVPEVSKVVVPSEDCKGLSLNYYVLFVKF